METRDSNDLIIRCARRLSFCEVEQIKLPPEISRAQGAPRALTLMMLTLMTAALGAPDVRAAAPTNIAGGWFGTMDVTSEFGKQKHYTERLALNQNGTIVSGSFELINAPPTPVLHGRVRGSKLTFAITIRGDLQMDFHLRLTGNQLSGFGTCTTNLGRVIARVNLAYETNGNP
jgi:hypothetical protein